MYFIYETYPQLPIMHDNGEQIVFEPPNIDKQDTNSLTSKEANFFPPHFF